MVTEPNILPDGVDSRAGPYFIRDQNRYMPTGFARGGWGPTISGHVVGGILAAGSNARSTTPGYNLRG